MSSFVRYLLTNTTHEQDDESSPVIFPQAPNRGESRCGTIMASWHAEKKMGDLETRRTHRGSLTMKKHVSASGNTLSPSPRSDGNTFMSWSVVYSDSRGKRSRPHLRNRQRSAKTVSKDQPARRRGARGQSGCITAQGIKKGAAQEKERREARWQLTAPTG